MAFRDRFIPPSERFLAAVTPLPRRSEEPLDLAAGRFRAAVAVMPRSRTRDHFAAVAEWLQECADEHRTGGRCIGCVEDSCEVTMVAAALVGEHTAVPA